MESDEISVDKTKVQEIITFLSERVLNLPEYDTNRAKAEKEIIELDNLLQMEIMTPKERHRHNSILEGLEVPENLFL